jgi:hypothetical protein
MLKQETVPQTYRAQSSSMATIHEVRSAQETIQQFADPSAENITLSFLTPTIEDVHPSAL